MRYFLSDNTLFIRGSFHASGTLIPDGSIPVSTIICLAAPTDLALQSSAKELELASAAEGVGRDYTGFIMQGRIQDLCVFQYDFLTLFIMVSFPDERPEHRKSGTGATGIIVCSSQGMSDTALHDAIKTVDNAKAETLAAAGWEMPIGSPSDPVIVASEGAVGHSGAEAGTPAGDRIRAALLYGIPEAVRRSRDSSQNRPAFFIFSRFKGEHWVEWIPEDCPYYPCHFKGQRCDFCYCPLYPCGDESLGQWAPGSNGGKVWNCAACTMIHEPAVAEYLKKYPEVPIRELIRFWKKGEKAVAEGTKPASG